MANKHPEGAAFLRDVDWARTPLGPIDAWPTSLRTIAKVVVESRFPMALWWTDQLYNLYNDAYRPILGDKHPDALGKPGSVVWSEIWDILGPQAEGILAGEPATWNEHLLLPMNRKGYVEETYFTFSYSPVPDDAGGVGGVLVTCQETTKQVQGERQLETLRQLAALASAAKTANEACELASTVLGRNDADIPFAFLFLREADGEHARLVTSVGVPSAPPGTAGLDEEPWPLATTMRSRQPVVVRDLAHPMPGGRWGAPSEKALCVPIQRSGEPPYGVLVCGLSPRREETPEYLSFLSLVADQIGNSIGNARAVEEQIRRAEALAAIDRAKTAFFSNVSHEFRTPLTLMLGPLGEALASAEGALAGEDLETVHRNGQRLLKLVNTLLDYSRIEAGRARACYEPTDLSALTADLASAFRSAMDRAGLRFDVECLPLPGPVHVDHAMWEKIVLNLLSNALKFTFEGTVRVRLSPEADAVRLVVEDTGVGIPAEELPRMFERFHRIAGTRARTHEGTGIGLALVRDLVALHGGHIEVSSTLGRGTTFTITMPTGTAHLPAAHVATVPLAEHQTKPDPFVQEALRWLPRPEGEASIRPVPPGDPGRARVLVVDDNADMRDYLRRIFGQQWSVETASDGEAALRAVRARAPDVVVSDVMMPGLDGFGLVEALRKDPATREVPVILLSARAGEEAVAEGLRSGAEDYLVKPFSAGTLLVRVEAQLAAARARKALRAKDEAERERLQALFDAAPAAMVVFRGPSLVVEMLNPATLAAWGKTRDVLGKPLLEAMPELRGQGFEDILLGVYRTGTPYVGKAVLARLVRQTNGEPEDVYFDFVYAPIRDGATVTGVFVHAFEVTALVAERRAAEAANRMKDEFLTTVSHELRTPLSAILGWSSMLASDRRMDPARIQKGIEVIERNARSQLRIVEDILDVSRIIRGQFRIESTPIELQGVLAEAVESVRPAAEAKGIRLACLGGENPYKLVADPERLRQVFWNLLANAVKFTPNGGAVTVSVEQVSGNLVVKVRDTGQGIAADFVPFVFDRFRQADASTSRKTGGLGLGLAIVRHLVEMHGGSVRADSEGIGRGATFTVTLPVKPFTKPIEVSSTAQQTFDDEGGRLQASPSLSGVRLLVVEDEADSRDLIEFLLQSEGANVRSVGTAEEALAEIESFRPDMLVSDIGMSGNDGYWLLEEVRRRHRRLPAVALTAYTRREDVMRARAAGFDEHVGKPVDPDRLVQTLLALRGAPISSHRHPALA